MSDFPQDQATSGLISKLQNWSPDVYNALKSLQLDLDSIRALLAKSPDELTATGVPGTIESLIWPESSNPPPNADSVSGKGFFNTSRKRHAISVDTYDYYDISTPESAKLTQSAGSKSIPNNAVTTLPVDTIAFNNMMDTSITNTIKVKLDGRYLIGAHVRWATSAVGRRVVQFQRNGTTLISVASMAPIAGVQTDQGSVTMENLTVGDTLIVQVYQDSGGALNIETGASFSPLFWVHRLG